MGTKQTEADEAASDTAAAAAADLEHPALDSASHADTAGEQNRIDLNDPSLTGREAVEQALAAQAKD